MTIEVNLAACFILFFKSSEKNALKTQLSVAALFLVRI